VLSWTPPVSIASACDLRRLASARASLAYRVIAARIRLGAVMARRGEARRGWAATTGSVSSHAVIAPRHCAIARDSRCTRGWGVPETGQVGDACFGRSPPAGLRRTAATPGGHHSRKQVSEIHLMRAAGGSEAGGLPQCPCVCTCMVWGGEGLPWGAWGRGSKWEL
jgi:hypothetical protein